MTATTVPDAPYPFYYIPTSYPSAGACESAYSYCNSQYMRCTSALAEAGDYTTFVNPVEISVLDGQHFSLHAAPTTTPTAMPTADANSVCSSLRSRACYDLRVNYCTAFGTGRAGNQAVDSNGDNAARNLRHFLRDGNANDIIVVGVVVIAAGAGIRSRNTHLAAYKSVADLWRNLSALLRSVDGWGVLCSPYRESLRSDAAHE
ncbi:hypothetical protein KEM54_002319, partial [Ascosphaera aggregata]